MRSRRSTGDILDLLPVASASLSHVARDLQPYTEYDFRVVASNSHGRAHSDWVTLTTEEGTPGPIDPPVALEVKSRSLVLKWQCPSMPNGKITHYNILQNSQLQATVPGTIFNYTVTNLRPYTDFWFCIEGCTSKGCSRSAQSPVIETLPDAPEGIPAPELLSDTPTSVLISWQLPQHPNGILEKFTIERRMKDTQQIVLLVTLPVNHSLMFRDQTAALSPWKTYEYRITASTINGGTNISEWSEVTTRPSRPAGVQPPEVLILGPDIIKVTWKAPLVPNGVISSYEIRMPDPRITLINSSSLSHLVANLIPYTNYSITIVACSCGGEYLGGCTESLPTNVTTQPTLPQGISTLSATPISESFVAVSWQPPSRPNGPNLRYELLRRAIRQPLAANPPEDSNLWRSIYSGARCFYEDKGLSRYTTYSYKLMVHNELGYTPSQEVSVTTMAGHPVRGSILKARSLNHTAIEAEWSKPTLQDLQGDVEHYILFLNSTDSNQSLMVQADVNSTVIGSLRASTNYQLMIQAFNGAHDVNSSTVHVTTADGEPEGMFPPEVVVINRTAVRVIWTSPSNPNGVVTEYSIHINGKHYKTGMNEPGSYILADLFPFTVYNLQMEVCTVYACVKSNTTQFSTVEDEPAEISAPIIYVISSRSVEIEWDSPGRPNGIILSYEILRKMLRPCAATQQLEWSKHDGQCTYIQCRIHEDLCGDQCFDPVYKVCCDGVTYPRKPGHICCEKQYRSLLLNSSEVCCGGQVRALKSEHHCCGGYFIQALAGEACCHDKEQNRVSVGTGDACCGGAPYSRSGNQICCNDSLYNGFDQQCCGGQIVKKDFICCGDEEGGRVYRPLPGMFCCGSKYVNISHTLCCSAAGGEFKAHILQKGMKCCEAELIAETEECCHGVGYDPMKYVCSDKMPASMEMKSEDECSPAVLCPASMNSTAYCGRCDFNPNTHICAWKRTYRNVMVENLTEAWCETMEKSVYRGEPNKYSFTEQNLAPYTTYQYRVVAWNSIGRGLGNITRITTKQDVPQGVNLPTWTKVGNSSHALFWSWKEPDQPNGIIIHYIVLRDGMERFRGTEQNFTDTGGIKPYHEYTYQLRACTIAGCKDSSKVVAATVQGSAENVHAPTVSAVNSTALLLRWRVPGNPNGFIREYRVNQTGKGLIYTETAGGMQHTVTDLQPHHDYGYTLTACNADGCTSSLPSAGRTLPAVPQGVWSNPQHLIVNATSVELYWTEPERANGIISRYQLRRNGLVVFTGDSCRLNFTDAGLWPNTSYTYQLEATTGGGLTASKEYVVQTPLVTPDRIPTPHTVTVLGPYSLFLAWDPPGLIDSRKPLEYNVLLNPGTMFSQTHWVGQNTSFLVEELDPYTLHGIRIQACQAGSCGVGTVVYARTREAKPEDLKSPDVKPSGPSVIEIKWLPPQKPNGKIINYYIYRRPFGSSEDSLIFVWSEGILEFTDASGDLRPHAVYEYKITACNSVGSVHSPWASARTKESAPQGMEAPGAQATSAYAVLLHWTQPVSPNGVISQYHVVYQEQHSDPTLSTPPVTALIVTLMNEKGVWLCSETVS